MAAQRKIDYDVNPTLAKRARAAGTKTYVLVSSGAANAASWNNYLRMKGELENAVRDLNFERNVIIRFRLIVGFRQDSRPSEAAMRKLATFAGAVSGGLHKNSWAQDAVIIARAAVSAELQALKREKKVWMVDQADVMRLDRAKWRVRVDDFFELVGPHRALL